MLGTREQREPTRKVTAHISAEDLDYVMQQTGKGLTDILNEGVALMAAREAGRELLKLQGKVKFSVDLMKLRKEED